MAAERLQKLMAAAGFCSRRRGEELLREGRVQVNGRVADLGDRADAGRDDIRIDGRPLQAAPPPLTLLLNKPEGVLCTCHDPGGRPAAARGAAGRARWAGSMPTAAAPCC